MTRLSDTELEAMLKDGNSNIEPPADLAARIKSEIPEDLGSLTSPASPKRSPQRTWLMAAGLLAALGASLLTFQLQREVPQFDGASEETLSRRGAAADDTVTSAPHSADSQSVLEATEATAREATAREATAREATARETTGADPEPAPAASALAKPPAKKSLAEVSSPQVVGRVLDSGVTMPGVAVPGATVEQSSDGESRSVASDATGRFDFKDLAPEEPLVREEKKTTLEAEMSSAIEESIIVTAETPLLDERKVTTGIQVQATTEAQRQRRTRQALAQKQLIPKPTARELERIPTAPDPWSASGQTPGVQTDNINTGAAQRANNVNDEAYDQMYFESAGTNPFVDAEDDRLSTFGLDVDTGSYTVTRRYLRDGNLPPKDAVRVEEFVNYFDYRDAPPHNGYDFALHAQGAPSIYGEGERYHLLRFGLHGRELEGENRKPALLTFVVDVSGSMAREDRLGLVRQALTLLVEQLRDDDRMALVVYGSSGRVLLEPTGDRQKVLGAISRLQSGGSTNAGEGLRLAYEMAARHTRAGTINRIILCSDGVANVGNTGPDSILASIEEYAKQGIELTTVGFGMGNYNDVLMEQLADRGNGRYAYVDHLEEARRIFVEDLTGTLQTLAAEARAQVEFDPEVVSRYRLLGYENRDIADERFRDDTIDAGEIGVGHRVTALYEIKTHRPLRKRDRIATLHLRYASIARGKMVEQSLKVTGADFARSWDKAGRELQLTSLVAEFAEILKGSYWAKNGDLNDVFQRAQRVATKYPGDADIAEFASLVGRVQRIHQR